MLSNLINPRLKYGILLSGGLDSAVLLASVLKTYTAKGCLPNIQPFTIPKHDGSEMYINDIIKYMNTRFLINLPSTILVGDPNIDHDKQSRSAIIDILNCYSDIDYIFIGLTKNPPVKLKGLEPIRKIYNPTKKIICPFKDFYKTFIVNLVYQEGWEELLNITHTCTEQKIGRCNKCWQCNERAWAFNQLNKIDTGTS